MILQDPAVESLSSFIGVDGTNTTLNSGRIQINLKPLEERKMQRGGHHPAAAAGAGEGRRHHALHAAGAGSDGGRPREPHAVSVHAWRMRTPTELDAVGAAAGRKAADAAGAARRGQRPAERAACRRRW